MADILTVSKVLDSFLASVTAKRLSSSFEVIWPVLVQRVCYCLGQHEQKPAGVGLSEANGSVGFVTDQSGP